jgi:hypothetical protein
MLHPLALENWQHAEAERFRQQINFTGVFIPTDRNWNKQIDSLGQGKLDTDSQRCLEKCAFTTHILRSLLDSMLCRLGKAATSVMTPHRPVILSPDDESYLARELADAWKLADTTLSLQGLRHALMRRLSDLDVFASQEASRSATGRADRIANMQYLHLSYLPAAGLAVEIFNDKTGEPGAHWAFLFDELELAPGWIRQELIQSLRSVDERFLFKLSLSPYCEDLNLEVANAHVASQQQDFEVIRLWYVHKEHGYPFCRELLARMLKDRGLPPIDPVDLFGRSVFSTVRDEWQAFGTAYRRGSKLANRFVGLAAKDSSFREYLKRKKIDCHHLEQVAGDKRASDIRKVTSIVALRDYFKSAEVQSGEQGQQHRRSRKVSKVYAGGDSLFAMVEGNPRWFIGIVGRLLNNAKSSPPRVNESAQVREVDAAADVFCAMLKTIPCAPIGGSQRGLLSLLNRIGEFFSAALIREPFDPEPPCSFVVDSRTDDECMKALGSALNAGAIVFAPDQEDSSVLETLRGKRFRLSYLLASHYQIALLLGRGVSLSKIIRGAKEITRSQPTLFG